VASADKAPAVAAVCPRNPLRVTAFFIVSDCPSAPFGKLE
jgi:hypothetical protein